MINYRRFRLGCVYMSACKNGVSYFIPCAVTFEGFRMRYLLALFFYGGSWYRDEFAVEFVSPIEYFRVNDCEFRSDVELFCSSIK